MCTPFTRSVFLVLDFVSDERKDFSFSDLSRKILAHDWKSELRTNKQLVLKVVDYLVREGSLEMLPGGRLKMTPQGARARVAAEEFAAAKLEVA
jgi:hypothetical protein